MLRRTIPAFGLLALLLASGTTPVRATEQAKAEAPHAPAKAEAAPSAEAHAGPVADDHDKPDIMKVEKQLALWTLVVFVGLMLVLGRFAWKPLLKALHERESHLQNVLLDSEKARNEAEALANKNRKELAQAADQVRALIEEARKEAQVAANSIIQKAQAEAEASRHRAEREIAGAKDQALMEIWTSTADLAVSVAGKVLGKELNDSDHRRLVEVAMQELPANGNNGREGARS